MRSEKMVHDKKCAEPLKTLQLGTQLVIEEFEAEPFLFAQLRLLEWSKTLLKFLQIAPLFFKTLRGPVTPAVVVISASHEGRALRTEAEPGFVVILE